MILVFKSEILRLVSLAQNDSFFAVVAVSLCEVLDLKRVRPLVSDPFNTPLNPLSRGDDLSFESPLERGFVHQFIL